MRTFTHTPADGFDALLINPPYPRRYGGGLVPPIGLCYLAAALREVGANPAILDLVALFPNHCSTDYDAPVRLVHEVLARQGKKPNLIGIGPLVTANLRSTKKIIEACREGANATIAVGGPLCSVPGISMVSKDYLNADIFIAGDGERPIETVWKGLKGENQEHTFQGIGHSGCAEPAPYRQHNLDLLPIPARDLLPHALYKSSVRRDIGDSRMTAAFLSRGCPYSCSFCAAPLSSGKTVRRLSPSRVSQEIAACQRSGFTSLIFYDDCLFIKSSKLNTSVFEFSEAIRDAQWTGSFQLELRCDAVMALSDEALRALVAAGCRQINMGIEKGHIAKLEQLRKKLSPEIARDACERVRSSGIRAAGTFILGGPGERPEDLEATIDFATSLSLDFAHFNPMAIYPGTPLFSEVFGEAASQDWLQLCLDLEWSPLGDILWRSSETPLNVILNSVAEGYRRFYSTSRLENTLKYIPEAERQATVDSYDVLLNERARSWQDATAPATGIPLLSC